LTSDTVTLIVLSLLAVNVVAYSLLFFNIRASRKRKVEVSSLPEAFHVLERAIRENIADLPAGFTWGEALNHLRMKERLDLADVERALTIYEAHRYGGLPLGNADYHAVLKVADRVSGIRLGVRP